MHEREAAANQEFSETQVFELPDSAEFPGRRPFVFFLPALAMTRDADGNGAGIEVRDPLKELAAVLRAKGLATYRYAALAAPSFEVAEATARLRSVLDRPEVDREALVLLGFAEGADAISRNYYDFYAVQPPRAAVLLSPVVSPIQFNNLTCPYLVLHGQLDPQFEAVSYHRVEEAVHHHLSRYGDLTGNLRFPQVGKWLGAEGEISRNVLRQVSQWVCQAVRDNGRPQEPGVASAA